MSTLFSITFVLLVLNKKFDPPLNPALYILTSKTVRLTIQLTPIELPTVTPSNGHQQLYVHLGLHLYLTSHNRPFGVYSDHRLRSLGDMFRFRRKSHVDFEFQISSYLLPLSDKPTLSPCAL